MSAELWQWKHRRGVDTWMWLWWEQMPRLWLSMLPDRGGDGEAALLRVRRSSGFFLASMCIFNPFPYEENAMVWTWFGVALRNAGSWERIVAGMRKMKMWRQGLSQQMWKRFCACKGHSTLTLEIHSIYFHIRKIVSAWSELAWICVCVDAAPSCCFQYFLIWP